MSTQAARGPPIRGYQRRKAVLDLNVPPAEIRDREGTSTEVRLQEAQAGPQQRSIPPAPIDVDALDDDVIESSPRAFAEAKNKSKRIRVIDLDSGGSTRVAQNNRTKRRRVPFPTNLESTSFSMQRDSVTVVPPPPPPPPPEPTFSCPICMGPLVEEMSTKCGHIFCKRCIIAAIKAASKCPTCRKKVTQKELIRVFLPATN